MSGPSRSSAAHAMSRSIAATDATSRHMIHVILVTGRLTGWLLRCGACIHAQLSAADVPAAIGDEVEDGVADVLGLSPGDGHGVDALERFEDVCGHRVSAVTGGRSGS